MDLLSGYGSDEESGDDRPKSPRGPHVAMNGDFAASEPGPIASVKGSGQSASVSQTPEPGASNLQLAAKLPAPRKKVKKLVQLQAPITVAPDSSDEDERPKKKMKASSKGLSLSAFLPPPKHTADTTSNGLLGSGHTEGQTRVQLKEDSDEEMAGPDPYRSETVLGEGNEAYRVFDQPGDVPSSGGPRSGPAGSAQGLGSGEMAGQSGAPVIGDQLLQQALADEQAKAAKNGLVADPFSGVQFKEISQQKLTYMPPEQREAKNATRTAFGNDYEQRIREEAGDEPEKKAKRKHQIHSLYHQAKMKELEMMELRGQAVKTKRETQAKYGWS